MSKQELNQLSGDYLHELLEDSDEKVRELVHRNTEHQRIEDVTIILSNDKGKYLSLVRFLTSQNVHVLLRNNAMKDHDYGNQTEDMMKKMIDNNCLHSVNIIPNGIIAFISNQPKKHRRTMCIGSSNNLYLYRTNYPYMSQELKDGEIIIGNFGLICLDNVKFVKKMKIRKLPRKYTKFSYPLKTPVIGTELDYLKDFLPYSPFRPVQKLTQQEKMVKFRRLRTTHRKYLLYGKELNIGIYKYEPNVIDLRVDFQNIISYEFDISSLLFLQTITYSFTLTKDIYILAIDEPIVVNDTQLNSNTCLRIPAKTTTKIITNQHPFCLFTLNPPSL